MNKTTINAQVVADSIDTRGNRLTSFLITFPRIILSEINTHRMLSKNTSSSRAIPFNKMVESIQNDPFIPIAWQKEHKGMQGSKYITSLDEIEPRINDWLDARNEAITRAKYLNDMEVTKQLCNRLLEPFMWTTMLITGSEEGWRNFFELRCPNYEGFKSKKEASKEFLEKGNINTSTWSDLDWLTLNKGQAEIHMMALAESIYDAYNESNPVQLLGNMYHVPFRKQINELYPDVENDSEDILKISVSMAARTSYTTVGDEKVIPKEKHIELYDKLVNQNPPHSSPLEHVCKCMTDYEFEIYIKGKFEYIDENDEYIQDEPLYKYKGWCGPYKGFISYRYLLENKYIK